MKKHFLKALSLIMAVSLLCSCASQENTSSLSPAPETSSTQQESSTDETTASSQGTSKAETEETTKPAETELGTTAITTTTPKPETTTTTTTTESEPVQDVRLDIEGVNSYVDFPSGSGLSAVATVLKYYGIDVTMEELYNAADIYADLSLVDGLTPSPWEKIVVSPATTSSVYFAPPIINMANEYLSNIGSTMKAKDVSGKSVEDLLSFVASGKPIIIWATETGKAAPDGLSWIADNGDEILTKAEVKVYVIVGFNTEQVTIMGNIADTYDVTRLSLTEMYQSVYSQAVLIE